MKLLLSKKWKITTTLGEVAEVVGGGTPSTKEAAFWDGDIPWITPKDLSNYQSVYITGGERYISEVGLKNSSAKLLPENSILFSSRAPIGYVAINKIPVTTNQGFKSLVPKKDVDFKFLYYWILYNKENIEKQASGSTFAEISGAVMKNIQITLPESIEDQKEIASILGSLDDKIELLRRENKTLESIAQALFKEWFVDFRFPGHENVKMVGGVPEGWKVFSLSEIVNVVNGYSYKGSELKEKSNQALVTLKSFDRNGGFQTRGFKPFYGTPKPKQQVFVGDLVVAHTDLTQDAEVLGNPAFIFENGGFEKMYITMDLVKVNSKVEQIKNPFLYFLMQTREFKSHCTGYSNGTTVLHLSKKAIPEYEVILPEDLKLCEKFSDFAEQSTLKMSNNILEIQILSKLRDNLSNKIFNT